MIPYEVDPSLHQNKPQEPLLEDGFSPPDAAQPAPPASQLPPDAPDPLGEKSGF
jgi:hypothetical protein